MVIARSVCDVPARQSAVLRYTGAVISVAERERSSPLERLSVFAGKIQYSALMIYLGLIGTISPRFIMVTLVASNPFSAIVRFRSRMG